MFIIVIHKFIQIITNLNAKNKYVKYSLEKYECSRFIRYFGHRIHLSVHYIYSSDLWQSIIISRTINF